MENLLHAFSLTMNLKKDMPHRITLNELENCYELIMRYCNFGTPLKFLFSFCFKIYSLKKNNFYQRDFKEPCLTCPQLRNKETTVL